MKEVGVIKVNINILAFALSLTTLMQVLIMLTQYRKSERKIGIGWWSIGALFATAAFASYEFRHAHFPFSHISIFFNNFFFVAALASVYAGIRVFFGESKRFFRIALFTIASASLLAVFSMPGTFSYPARRSVLLISITMITMPCGLIVWKNKNKTDRNWANILTFSFSSLGLISLIGSVAVFVLEKKFGIKENELSQSGVYFASLVASSIWTFGFISIINHRINASVVQTREKFEMIFSDGPDAALIIGRPEANVKNANEAFFRLTGMEREEVLNKAFSELELFADGDDLSFVEERLENIGLCENIQMKITTEAGDILTVLLSAKRVLTDNFVSDLLVLRDITERERAEQRIKTAREQYRLLFENALEAVLVAQAGRIKLVNPVAEEITGYSLSELTDMPVLKLVYAEDHGNMVEDYLMRSGGKRLQSNNDVDIRNFRVLTKQGQLKWAEMKTINIQWEGKAATLNFISDVSEREKAIIDMLESESKYRLVAEFASDVIWVYNISKQKLVFISPSVSQLRGFTPEEALEIGFEGSFTPESLQIAQYSMTDNFEKFKQGDQEFNSFVTELQHLKKDGSSVWVEESVRYRYNAEGEAEAIGVSRKIEERKKATEEILFLSYHDQLTQLKNRRYYDEIVKEINTEDNLPLCMIMADVNGLKVTNDAFGHRVGDRVLKEVAKSLRENCRSGDHAIRMGGDEFIVLLPKTEYHEAQIIRSRITKAIESKREVGIGISISMGIAVKNTVGEKFEDVFRTAEDDMYRHKLANNLSLRSSTINVIMNTLYEKNNREMLHSKRVSELCEAFAFRLKYDENEINQLRLAGLMHDIGKIGIDESILNHPGVLDEKKRRDIQRHSEIGYRVLSAVNEFSEIANCVLEHHERWDGKGYPRSLKGNQISIHARIICLTDAYDAMTSQRSYRNTMTDDEAAAEIQRCAGSQFDPNLAKVFVEEVLKKQWK